MRRMCVACAGYFVVRYRRRDRRPFYGCINFPSCTNSMDIPKRDMWSVIGERPDDVFVPDDFAIFHEDT